MILYFSPFNYNSQVFSSQLLDDVPRQDWDSTAAFRCANASIFLLCVYVCFNINYFPSSNFKAWKEVGQWCYSICGFSFERLCRRQGGTWGGALPVGPQAALSTASGPRLWSGRRLHASPGQAARNGRLGRAEEASAA